VEETAIEQEQEEALRLTERRDKNKVTVVLANRFIHPVVIPEEAGIHLNLKAGHS
jgi:hypothetical protein